MTKLGVSLQRTLVRLYKDIYYVLNAENMSQSYSIPYSKSFCYKNNACANDIESKVNHFLY